MYHDPDLHWLAGDVTVFGGIVAAIHLVARDPIWGDRPTYDALLATIPSQQLREARGLNTCWVVCEHRRAA